MPDLFNIHELDLIPSVANDDELAIWDVSTGQTNKVAVSGLLGFTVTGGGTIALGGFTLTVPQNLTAAGRDVANTFSADQTFSGNLIVANASNPIARVMRTGLGYTALAQSMAGLGLHAGGMSQTNLYTPAIKFGSADSDFTTTNPKFLAGIVGYATESYAADTASGMGMRFFTTPDGAGAAPVPVLRLVIDQNGNVRIGGVTPGALLHVGAGNDAPVTTAPTLYVSELGSTSLIVRDSQNDVEAAFRATSTGLVIMGSVTNHPVRVITNNGIAATFDANNNLAINQSAASISSGAGIDVNGSTFRLRTARTPASAGAPGNTGEICWDSSFLYICIAANTWRRIAHSTW